MHDPNSLTLVCGATGYVGGKLLPLLERDGRAVRCLVRDPKKLDGKVGPHTRLAKGDVTDGDSLREALGGVGTAYYLVHLMAEGGDFAADDRNAAKTFADAARATGLRRIIYLGGLGDDNDPKLSPHLRSRHEVGDVLRTSGAEVVELRAGMIVGAGSLSFEMLRSLTDRLPIMLCPSWLATKTQPIAIDDVLAYLLAAADLPYEGDRTIEIGGPEVLSYKGLVREYALRRGLKRFLIPVPFVTPWLSSLWMALVTPHTYSVGRHLVEGLRNPTLVRDDLALRTFPEIHPMGARDAIRRALGEPTD